MKTEASSKDGRAERMVPPGCKVDVECSARPALPISILVLHERKKSALFKPQLLVWGEGRLLHAAKPNSN